MGLSKKGPEWEDDPLGYINRATTDMEILRDKYFRTPNKLSGELSRFNEEIVEYANPSDEE
ncbi:MAG: hypothetical protein ABIA78_03645 [archaeon]